MSTSVSIPSRAAEVEGCLHCGAALAPSAATPFCCAGCARVHALLTEQGLTRYYDLRGATGLPATGEPRGRDRKWLEPVVQKLASAEGLERVAMDVQGVHCAACVWLLSSLFERQAHGAACLVNPSRGRIELTVDKGFDLPGYVSAVESVGYLLGPPLKTREKRADELTLRMGISLALALNTMMFAVAIYLGLREGPLYELVHDLGFALSLATVVVGGSFFLRSAWQSLRRGLLHLDLPIAVGIALATAGSVWAFFARSGAEYFDTLAIFIALMLVGRWVQERVVAQNRARLLSSEGVDGLYARRVRRGVVELVRCVELEQGDELLLAPGDLVPVDAELAEPAALRLDWINGESEPRALGAGALAPAGAFNAGSEAVRARASTAFSASPLIELLTTPRAKEAGEQAGRFWDRLARVYVAAVLVLAAGGFVLWMALTGDASRALSVTTAILVVTCPCAFGIAAPLAQDLVQASLRKTGLFVRTDTLLSRAQNVRRVVFDKTGTLTTGVPELADPAPLAALRPREREILYNLAARSQHPKSTAVAAALASERYDASIVVHEQIGAGVQARVDAHLWRVGRPSWAAPSERAQGDLVFAKDGRAIAILQTQEHLRHDAKDEIERLHAQGYEAWILSGDAPEKVRALARELGVAQERALGGATPQGKAEWLARNDAAHTLFVGDGINDGLAADRALCAGTPAIDRPFMPARSDFYFVTPGLSPIRRLLESAERLRAVVRADLASAVLYNAGAVALAYAGLVSPWVAAVLMPLSSVGVLLYTSAALAGRAPWRS